MPNLIDKLTEGVLQARLRTIGIDDDDLDKPRVAICNSYSEMNLAHLNFREVAQRAREGVLAAGGIPVEFGVFSVCDGVAHGTEHEKYILPARDLIADAVETFMNAHGVLDALICIGTCDKVLPGMLLAGVRHNIPTIFIGGGAQDAEANRENGECACDAITQRRVVAVDRTRVSDERYLKAIYLKEVITREEFSTLYYATNSTRGVCRAYATAATMSLFTEALGASLADGAMLPETSTDRLLMARRTGAHAVRMAQAGLRPRDIITPASLRNALRCVMTIGGSMNVITHALALANAAGYGFDYTTIDELARSTPFLVDLKRDHSLSLAALRRSGGVFGLLRALGDLVERDCQTVNFATIGELVDVAHSGDAIRPRSNPIDAQAAIRVLRGSLAPNGSLFNVTNIPPERRQVALSRQVVVYESNEDFAERAVVDPPPAGAAIIIRNEGPVGGPGMRELHRVTEVIAHLNMDARDLILITDGRYSGASAGYIVGYVSPEAAIPGSPLSLVETGDTISLCIDTGELHLLVDEVTLSARRATHASRAQPIPANFPYLVRYRRSVTQCDHGAVLE